jgi:hypothetical protein
MPAWQSNTNTQQQRNNQPQHNFSTLQNNQNIRFSQNKQSYQNNQNNQNYQNTSFSRSHQDIVSDLLSPEECLNAFNEFLSKLSMCKSRHEQLQVIATITIKYLHK